MELLPVWKDRLKRVQVEKKPDYKTFRLKKAASYYSRSINYVASREEAQNMVDFTQQRPLSHIGIDSEFKYDRPGVPIDKNNTVNDPRSIHPLLLSLALAEPQNNEGGNLYCFVVDLRKRELIEYITPLLYLPVCFVGHNLKVELFCLWQLKLTEPNIIWDTFIHEKALYLGQNHVKYKMKKDADEVEEIRTKEESAEEDLFRNSLVATCQRYGVPFAFEKEKKRLQQSFLTHGDNDPFSEEQIRYAAEDALAAARMYPQQINTAGCGGILEHLVTVEMPWIRTNARIEWNGIRVATDSISNALEDIETYIPLLEQRLEHLGLNNVRSHKQLKEFFQREGILRAFYRNGKYSFKKEYLKLLKHLHPVIPLIRSLRRAYDIKANKIMLPELIGRDGRMHPVHTQLGTDTGRQSSKWPNILALDSLLRPLIVSEPGNAIGEVDLSQIEIGVAAAVFHDNKLIEMFNTGDVYSAMAQSFFRDGLTDESRDLPGNEFKYKHSELRNKMKTCTLGIIYGMTPHGLAQQLNTTKANATALQHKFMSMFPTLKSALLCTSVYGSMRGYSYSVSGLRRHRGRGREMLGWEQNWMVNFPVQGTAATIFKTAGNRLDKLYQQYDAWLIIPLHDAFIFEAPFEELKTVAQLTERVMCETIQEFFPMLKPKVEVNIMNPECWNKEGDTKPLAKWIEKELTGSLKEE
jgi:DNA polymerase-1